jgi:choline dehydrogenase-like flavoprotein
MVPGMAGAGAGTKYDWNVTYLPTPYVANRTIPRAVGKVVGGGTKLNIMAFDRGSKADYNRFAALGSRGWNWTSLFPYFKKASNSTPIHGTRMTEIQLQSEIFAPPHPDVAAEFDITYDPEAHGYQGYINSTFSPWLWPTTSKIPR